MSFKFGVLRDFGLDSMEINCLKFKKNNNDINMAFPIKLSQISFDTVIQFQLFGLLKKYIFETFKRKGCSKA